MPIMENNFDIEAWSENFDKSIIQTFQMVQSAIIECSLYYPFQFKICLNNKPTQS